MKGNREKKKYNVRVRNRDIDLFWLIFRFKVVNFEIIKGAIFSDISEQNARRRVLKLEQGGYLKSRWIEMNGVPFKIYQLNKKINWREIFEGKDIVEVFHSSSTIHDLILAKIGIVFQKISQVQKLWSESEIKGLKENKALNKFAPFAILNSDLVAELCIKEESYNVALEYERSLKKKDEYKEKFESYYSQDGVHAIIYICENENIMRTLTSYDSKFSTYHNGKMFFGAKKDLFSEDKKVSFFSSDNRELVLEKNI